MKRSEQIIHALGLVKEEYIQQAAPGKNRGRGIFAGVASAAACAAVLLTLLWSAAPKTPVSTKFPDLTFKTAGGSKGFIAYDASELVHSGPWEEEAELSALPVYKNLWVRNGAGEPPQMEEEEEKALVAGIRRQFGGMGEIGEIRVEGGHGVRVIFSESISVPEEYRQNSTYEQAEKTAGYLLETYGAYLGFQDPVTEISGGDSNIYGERSFQICFYENGDTLLGNILNSCFRSVRFVIIENGIYAIDLTMKDLSEEVGSYPALSTDQAKELLYQGYFLTGDSSMTVVPGARIEKVYLTYCATGFEEYYIPYYVFVIETDGEIEGTPGLKVYGTYYVPAVPLEYIQGMNGFPENIS